jgi:hypothetical protein
MFNTISESSHPLSLCYAGIPDHGFLYDALNVYHRAPIPSDLEGEEINADDYRLFIRYNEFYKKSEKTIPDKEAVEGEHFPLLFDHKPTHKIVELEHFLSKEPISKLKEETFVKYSESFLKHLPLDLTPLISPNYNISKLFEKLEIRDIRKDIVFPIAPKMDFYIKDC